jgi:predicted ester cyclase
MSATQVQDTTKRVWAFWQELNEAGPDGAPAVIGRYVHEDIAWHGPHPIAHLKGAEALAAGFWQPLLRAFPDLARTCEILIGGHRHWVASIGYFAGTFENDWLGIPATGRRAQIRYGEFSAVYEGRIVLTYLIPDVLDLIRQAGFQLVPPSLGEEGQVTGPLTGDGVRLAETDLGQGARTLALAKTMCSELNTDLCEGYWDPDNMVWYGPSGIGTCRTYQGFDDLHQQPFYHAFPSFGAERMGLHVAEVGDGNYAAWAGWPSVRAHHAGEYLGVPPTGNMAEWRLMDFYRRDGDRIIENWVPVDMIHLFLTMGVDLFAELEKLKGK